jgi:methylmalonyl-CoA/ethylmalonyl-CoA epimerase
MIRPARDIDHVAVAVADADEAAGRFIALLGLTVVADEIADEPGVRLVHLAGPGAAGPTTLQLVQPLRAGPVRDHLDQHGEGIHHICFTVVSVPGALADMPGEEDARIFTGGRGRPACFLAARPGGALIELVEQPFARGPDVITW